MKQAEKQNNQVPTAAQVQQQLTRILASSLFSHANKLSIFLSYIIDETLAGRAGRIKGFTIASEVFGRSNSGDADTTTIVRVEAGRLRRHLYDYYQSEGQNDPVYIEIPKGCYVPVFEFNKTTHSELNSSSIFSLNETIQIPTAQNTRYLFFIIPLLFFVTILTWQLYSLNGETDDSIEHNLDYPSVMVFPFENHHGSSGEMLAKGLTEDIITDLSRIPGLNVIALTSVLSLKESMNDYMDVAHKLDVKYVLHGSLRGGEQSNNIRITAQLYDRLSGSQLWAKRFDRKISDTLRIQDELSTTIIQGMAKSLPGINYQVKRSNHEVNIKAYELYKQAMNILNPPADPWRMITARRAFERVIELDSDWAGGYAGAAYTYAFNVWWGHSKEPDKELAQTFELANKALALDHSFGMANSALAFAYLSQRNFDKALSHSELAIKSQPGDPYVLAYHAYIHCANGDAETGLPFAQRALRIDPAFSRTPFLNILGLINFHTGKHARALELFERNIKRGGPSNPGIQAYQAAALASLGRLDEARSLYQLIELQKEIFDYEEWLRRSFRNENEVKKVLNELQKITSVKP